MLLAWVLGCGLAPEPVEIVDQGCACLQEGPALKVHLACVDCLDNAEVTFRCETSAKDHRLTVQASATLIGACEPNGSCAPLVGDCHDLPRLSEGPWVLVYGGAEVPVNLPLPASPVCACPGSRTTPLRPITPPSAR